MTEVSPLFVLRGRGPENHLSPNWLFGGGMGGGEGGWGTAPPSERTGKLTQRSNVKHMHKDRFC